MAEKKQQIITLLTDFGLKDNFAGVMKGVMLGINPSVQIVDISHKIEPQDILEAEVMLFGAYRYFPPGTIHVVVVDPAVGSSRRGIIALIDNYFFVGPDNGFISLIYLKSSGEKIAVEITNPEYFLSEISSTFHGRDIFAPVAAHLSKLRDEVAAGFSLRDLEKFGKLIDDPVILPIPEPYFANEKEIIGEIIYVDRFGNLMTNICQRELKSQPSFDSGNFRIVINEWEIPNLSKYYAQGKKGGLNALWGSSGFLEIFSYMGNASSVSGIKKGDFVRLQEL